ncbi:hypothetical protein HK107_02430 [Parvularcula sp. ZS-1/3]|uniref:VPLPA-CTERM sorting domain-containing protein n=1 Tax=Parvularcula mediterranea TaxID=2732508 RepID=A0A7Y3RJI8_9PROT|nr:hypothetical protein [Parvularcula mediterranea]NNU15181.1 hypothetical protein [Parvularcula mediterranea]
MALFRFFAAALIMMTAAPASAAIITATELGDTRGNDNRRGDKLAPVNDLLASLGYGPVDLYLGKLEEEGGGESGAVDMSAFSITGYSKPNGTFTFDLPDGFVLTHFTAKAGNGFAVFLMDEVVNAGTVDFDTGFTRSGLSHLSFFGTQFSDVAQVPLPAAAGLFAAGILLLAGRKLR